jgi:WD40 repeat protein
MLMAQSAFANQLWDVSTGKEQTPPSWRREYWEYLAVTPDGTIRAELGREDYGPQYIDVVKLWGVAKGGKPRILRVWTDIKSASFTPNGRTLALGDADGQAILFEVNSGKELGVTFASPDPIRALALTPDGTTLIVGSAGRGRAWDITVRDVATKEKKANLGKARSMALSPDGKVLATGGEFVRMWDITTLKRVRSFNHRGRVSFTPDGKLVAHSDWEVKLWDTATGRELTTIRKNPSSYNPLFGEPRAVTLDGKVEALVSGDDKKIKLRDVTKDEELLILKGHTEWVSALAFSSDGKTLASGSRDKTVRLWDVATGKELHTLRDLPDDKSFLPDVTSLQFLSDNKTLASAVGKQVKIWDVGTGKELRTLQSHTAWITCLAATSGGKLLASGSEDKTVKLWDPLTGKELATFKVDTRSVHCLAFTADGKKLATGIEDHPGEIGKVKLWDVAKILQKKGDK